MEKGISEETDRYLAIEAALRRSNLRLDAVRRYRKVSTRPYEEKNPPGGD